MLNAIDQDEGLKFINFAPDQTYSEYTSRSTRSLFTMEIFTKGTYRVHFLSGAEELNAVSSWD